MMIELGGVIDIIYPVLAVRTFYPVEAAGSAFILAFLPCAITRELPGGSHVRTPP